MAETYHDRILRKLTEGLAPAALSVRDESHKHAGHGDRVAAAGKGAHAPVDGQGETHFHVEVVSARFDGLSRVNRQRLVNDLLADELRERVHALSMRCQSPSEVG
ncbi:MAG: BolA family transcriptional regulator [Rhodospirillum sp.]|nr:BolA family transcriptional regulator [Rhodospirillum sp.]MCF8487566.1 BolA family transcriptional regulator [Rhodospirillum sp.]MCF8499049.1 BolA family transcriptional regulator [Rhodospirillum sp.]